MMLQERNFKHLLLVALFVGAAGSMAAQGCFSIGETTKVQFSQANWTRAETQDLFQWTDIQSRLTSDERVLSREEWAYLFMSRTDAYRMYARATVDGKKGLVLLPDKETWVKPEGLHFEYNDGDLGYATNKYSTDDWALMEAAGAVFLPAAGYSMDGVAVEQASEYGTYWTSSPLNEDESYYIQFDLGYLFYENMYNVNTVYRSVRTVKAWEPQGIEEANAKAKAVKFFRDGQLFIERDGKLFNLTGTQVR